MERKKTFDAVETVRRIRDVHQEQLKDKTMDERLAFYRDKSRRLRSELEKTRQESTTP